MFCRKCGAKLPDDARFCSECGERTRNAYAQQEELQPMGQPYSGQPYPGQPYPNAASYPKRTGKKKLLIGLAIVAAVVAAIALYVFVLRASKPEDTIAKLEAAMEDLDVQEVIACFDQETRRQYEDSAEYMEGFGGLTGLVSDLGGLKVQIHIKDIQYEDSTHCTVDVDMRVQVALTGDSDETNTTLEMKKEGKEWVIDGSSADDIIDEMI